MRYSAEPGRQDQDSNYSRRGLKDAPGTRSWELFVSSYDSNSVLCYDSATRRFLGRLAAKGLVNPQGLAFGPDGNLYVTSVTNQVLRFDSHSGICMGVFAGGGGLKHPVDLAFGPDGNLYVASWETNQVLRYNGKTGVFLGVFVEAGSGGLSRPHGLTFGPDGNLYITSWEGSNQVLRFSGKTGAFLDLFAENNMLYAAACLRFGKDGLLYIACNTSHRIVRQPRIPGNIDRDFALISRSFCDSFTAAL